MASESENLFFEDVDDLENPDQYTEEEQSGALNNQEGEEEEQEGNFLKYVFAIRT